MAQERFSAGILRPMMPNTMANVVPACAAPTMTPSVKASQAGEAAWAMPHKPSAYKRLLNTMTRNAPKRSASMPRKIPIKPQLMF